MKALVFSEDLEIQKELLAGARNVSQDDPVAAVILGSEGEQTANELIRFGADRVYVAHSEKLRSFQVEPYTDAIESLAREFSPDLVMIGGTRRGRELAPRLSTRLKSGCIAECLDLKIEEGQLAMGRVVYIGKAVAYLVCNTLPAVCSIRPHSFEKASSDRQGEVQNFDPALREPRSVITDRQERPKGNANLTEAKVIVSVGRGMKKKDDLPIIQELADAIGGEVGCSRPLSSDLGWLPEEHHVGISGLSVKPLLYIAIGISGQLHHLVGIRDSRIIAAINIDKEAPIFNASDYCVTGDLYQVVPKLMAALKKRLVK